MENNISKQELLEKAKNLRNEVDCMIDELSQSGEESLNETTRMRVAEFVTKVEEIEKQMKQ